MNRSDSLINFWGPSKEYEHFKEKIIFPDSETPVSMNNQFITLSVHSDILPEWAKSEVNIVLINKIYEIYERFPSGRPLLEGVNTLGKKIVLVQKDEKGRIIFNFNPQEAIDFLLEEKYREKTRAFYTHLPYGFLRIIPPHLKKLIKWGMYRFNKPESSFPNWPIEKSVELIRALFLNCMQLQGIETKGVQGRFWPESKRFAIVLTHDVDSDKGFRNIDTIARMEEERGFVSTWFMLAKGYNKDITVLKRLIKMGHEIAMHGDYHDVRLSFLGKEEIRTRFKTCSDFIERYQVRGFRAPSLLHSQVLLEVLSEFGFYDSSIPDTGRLSPFPQTVGCCTVFPYINNNVLEIPITLPLDSSLIFLRFTPDEVVGIWKKKMQWVRQIGGALVLDTHPEPHFIADKRYLQSYRIFLDELSVYKDSWIATAGFLADWWKARISN